MTMDRPTFDERFDELSAIAYRAAFRLLGDRGEAEEVAQEALARAYARWRTVAGHDEPWVARVAINLAIGRSRKRRPRAVFDEALDRPADARDEAAVQRMELLEALRSLPRRQREVIALRYLADLPEGAVASTLHISRGSVKQHTHRALGRLRIDLAPFAPIRLEVDDA